MLILTYLLRAGGKGTSRLYGVVTLSQQPMPQPAPHTLYGPSGLQRKWLGTCLRLSQRNHDKVMRFGKLSLLLISLPPIGILYIKLYGKFSPRSTAKTMET